MAIRAWRVWENTQAREVKTFSHHSATIPLPKRQWHPDFMKSGGAEYGLSEEAMSAFVEQLVPAQARSTCFRLDDLVILGVPGEMTAELGLHAKEKARLITGAGSVVIGGLADEWVSYILSADEYRKGGYEASVSFYGETLGKTVIDSVAGAAAGLK
jgi:hypothetical protein